jgi:hypothetical protein
LGLAAPAAPAADPEAPAPAKGTLRLTIYPWADVYVDGSLRRRGTRSLKLRLGAGRHSLKAVHPTLPPQELAVEILAAKTTDAEILLGAALR